MKNHLKQSVQNSVRQFRGVGKCVRTSLRMSILKQTTKPVECETLGFYCVLKCPKSVKKEAEAPSETLRTRKTQFETLVSLSTCFVFSQNCPDTVPTPRNWRTIFQTLCWTLFNDFSKPYTRLKWPTIMQESPLQRSFYNLLRAVTKDASRCVVALELGLLIAKQTKQVSDGGLAKCLRVSKKCLNKCPATCGPFC